MLNDQNLLILLGILIILYICFNLNYSSYNEHMKNHDYNNNHDNNNINHHNNKIEFVLLYADWCGYCKAMKPDWDKIEKKYNGKNNLNIMSFEESKHQNKLQEFNVKGFPTIYTIIDGTAEEYNGGRSYDEMCAHIDSITA